MIFSFFFFFFFNDTATTEIYTLSLHDALPISGIAGTCAMNCLLAKCVPAAIILSMFSTATAFTLMMTSPRPRPGRGSPHTSGRPPPGGVPLPSCRSPLPGCLSNSVRGPTLTPVEWRWRGGVGMALDKDRIVAEAVALLDEGGLDGVTLRKLAQRLGVQAPTLYWH